MSIFNGPVTETIAGEQVQFSRLLLPDYEAVQNAAQAELSARALRLLTDCKVNAPTDRFVAMRDNTPVFTTFSHVEAFMDTSAGVRLVLRKSLERGGVQETRIGEILAKVDFVTGRMIALRVLCFRGDPPAQQPPDETGTGAEPVPTSGT